MQILQVILKHEVVAENVDFERVAEGAAGMTGSDLKEVCRLAVLRRAKELISRQTTARYALICSKISL